MKEFLKEWRAVILIALIMLTAITILAVVVKVTSPYVESKRAVCYKIAQEFIPPIQWRWNSWGRGDGCELFMNGMWFPADMVHPALK